MGRLRYGVHPQLEAAADSLIKEALAGGTNAEKSDILTVWKQNERWRREVYVRDGSGVPDPAIRSGFFHRAANKARPELNSREGIARAHRGMDSLSSFAPSFDPEDPE